MPLCWDASLSYCWQPLCWDTSLPASVVRVSVERVSVERVSARRLKNSKQLRINCVAPYSHHYASFLVPIVQLTPTFRRAHKEDPPQHETSQGAAGVIFMAAQHLMVADWKDPGSVRRD